MQAVFHTDIRLDDHTDRERKRYVSDLLHQGSDKDNGRGSDQGKDQDKEQGLDKGKDQNKNKGSDQDREKHQDSHAEKDLARQLIKIGERSSVGRNAPLGIPAHINSRYHAILALHTTKYQIPSH